MGSVRDVTMTGDNDIPIFPEERVIHYVYCDECGSFAIKHWIEPENHMQLMQWRTRLDQVATFFMVMLVISAILLFFGLLTPLIVAVIALIGTYTGTAVLARRIKFRGVYCADCQTRYENPSLFFDNVHENPRQLTMSDVKRPLYEVYQISG